MHAMLRIHQVTLGARTLLYGEGGKKDNFVFVVPVCDGLILVPNMLLQTWLLLLFCEAVLIIYGAVQLYSPVKWRSSLLTVSSVSPHSQSKLFFDQCFTLKSVLLYALLCTLHC